jgi:hypothetical protein
MDNVFFNEKLYLEKSFLRVVAQFDKNSTVNKTIKQK